MSKITTAQHANEQAISHRNLRSRFGAAFVAGCLALSVCPAIAFAAPGDAGEQNPQGQMGGNPPAAMQFDGQQGQAPSDMGQAPSNMGQAPTGEAPAGGAPTGEAPSDMGQAPEGMGQAPSTMGQAPEGMQQGNALRTDGFSDEVRQILSEKYGVTLPEFGANGGSFTPGDPADAPEIPEGEVNVQAVIDASRYVLDQFKGGEINLEDEDFLATLQTYAKASVEQRFALMHANMDAPSDLPSDEATTPSGNSGTAPDTTADSTVMSQIISLIMNVFNYAS